MHLWSVRRLNLTCRQLQCCRAGFRQGTGIILCFNISTKHWPHFPGLSRSWKLYKHNSRTFHEQWESWIKVVHSQVATDICIRAQQQALMLCQQGGHKIGEKSSLSFPGISRAINLLFHSSCQQKVNVIMTFIKGHSTSTPAIQQVTTALWPCQKFTRLCSWSCLTS